MKELTLFLQFIAWKMENDQDTRDFFKEIDKNKFFVPPVWGSIVSYLLIMNYVFSPFTIAILVAIPAIAWYKSLNNIATVSRWFIAEYKFYNKSKS